jgi:hypothetical protein
MIPQERRIKGISIFIIFYSPILVLVGKSGYMNLLGKTMWFFIACNYINLVLGLFGSSSFIVTSFSFIIDLGLGMGNEL